MLNPSNHLLAGAREFSIYVCQNRALPDVRDGFKSSGRIALWCMRNNNSKIKVAALSGEMVASSLYVHGDASGSISNMAAPYLNNNTMFDGRGAFGTLTAPHAIGAARYVYVSTSKFAKENVLLDKELYQMVPSVDGDTEICDSFLPIVPTVLLNGTEGMAVGWSTEILPHKLEDLKKAVINVLEDKSVGHIMPYWNNYDVDVERIMTDNDSSESYLVSGKIEVLNSTTIEIKSIPSKMDIEKLQTHLDNLIEDGKITAYENHTSENFSILVKLKRSDLEGYTYKELVKLLKIQSRRTERLVTIGFDGRSVKVFKNTEELIQEWTEWRLSFYTKRFQYKIDSNMDELEFLKNIIRCYDANIVEKLKGLSSKDALKKFVKDTCSREEPKIVEFPTYKWTIDEINKIKDRIKEIEALTEEYKVIVNDENLLREEFKKDILG